MRFKKKPVVIEATRWEKNGDHPEDNTHWIAYPDSGEKFLSEGKVVRYYRRPDDYGDRVCERCGKTMHNHGWIDTFEGGLVVCPGDWVITGVRGEYYPCKPDIFAATYEPEE